jgi:segregation and condensation protein B
LGFIYSELFPMRKIPTTPAVQLGSACLRYRQGRHTTGDCLPAWKLSPQNSQVDSAVVLSGQEPFESLARLEAVLLLAKEPLSSRKLAQFAGLEDGTKARTLIRKLNAEYDQAGRAFRVEEVAGGYQLLTRRKFSSWLRRLAHIPGEARLSSPALETLAVIAYRQPVLRADIEAIRGVNCGEILRQLMERDLVRISGRSEELGRPFVYATTRRFLHLFGLHSLEDLPRAVTIRNSPVLAGLPPGLFLASDAEDPSPSGEQTTAGYTVEDDDESFVETDDS